MRIENSRRTIRGNLPTTYSATKRESTNPLDKWRFIYLFIYLFVTISAPRPVGSIEVPIDRPTSTETIAPSGSANAEAAMSDKLFLSPPAPVLERPFLHEQHATCTVRITDAIGSSLFGDVF
jgi:hypothetical protein